MLNAIITDNNNEIKIYIDCSLNKINYGGIKYVNNVYQNINVDDIKTIYDLLKINSKCIYQETIDGYQIYLDQETNYKHYIKNNQEDFNLFFQNNGESLILSANKTNYNSNYKRFIFKDKIIKATAIFMIFISAFSCIDNTCALNINTYIESKKEIEENINDLTYEEIDSYLKQNDFIRENDILSNKKLFIDLIPYINEYNQRLGLRNKLKYLNIKYYDKRNSSYDLSLGFYNPLFPSNIYIRDTEKENFHVYNHEFIHFLQKSNYLYLEEAIAELFTHEYFNDDISSYYDEVYNLRLLIEIVGTNSILKATFSNDDSDLLDIIKNNLSKEESKKIISILKNIIPEDITSESQTNKELLELIYKLYENIYKEKMTENPNIFDNSNKQIYKVYFNNDYKNRKMNIPTACRLGIIDFIKISPSKEYIDEYNIQNYSYDESGNIYCNILVPTTNGVTINGEEVIFISNDIEYNIRNKNSKKLILSNETKK